MFLFSLQSLVLISKLPYIHFFHTVLKQIAPEYFEKSEPYLEAGKLNTVWVRYLYARVLKILLEMADKYKVDILKKFVKNFKGSMIRERYKTILHLFLRTQKTVSFITSFCNIDDASLLG